MVAGSNYGQGSSREHAAITPRFLGLQVVLAISFARIHWQNLANFGVLAIEFENASDYQRIQQGDVLVLDDIRDALTSGTKMTVTNKTRGETYSAEHHLSLRQIRMLLAGGLIPWIQNQRPLSNPNEP